MCVCVGMYVGVSVCLLAVVLWCGLPVTLLHCPVLLNQGEIENERNLCRDYQTQVGDSELITLKNCLPALFGVRLFLLVVHAGKQVKRSKRESVCCYCFAALVCQGFAVC